MKRAKKETLRGSIRSPMIEPLEARAYFDLVPTFTAALPATLIPTLRNNSRVTVNLTNTGPATVSGAYTVELMASTDPTPGAAADTGVATITKSGTFPANRPRPVTFSLTDFPDVPNGSYYLIAEVSGPLVTASENITATARTIAVTDPFLDLSTSVIIASTANDQVLPGKRVAFSLELFNDGNVPASGLLATDVGLTADGGATVIPLKAPTPRIRVPANGHQTVQVSETIPVGFTPGTYSWDVTVDPANTFAETNIANNTSLSTSELTVEPPYPDMLGTFSGVDKIVRGPDKGFSPGISLDFTSESQTTGALVATGTLFGTTDTTFQFTGFITTRGVFTGTGTSLPNPYVATYKGRLVGSKLTGTVVNTDGNHGVFTLTLGL